MRIPARRTAWLWLLLLFPAAPPVRAEEPSAAPASPALLVGPGRTVSLEYTLSLGDGTKAHDNIGREPLVYVHGQSQLLPALEQALVGLAVGGTRTVSLPPEQAFGPVDPANYRTFPTEQIPEEARKPGAIVMAAGEEGTPVPVQVREVTADGIVLDLNHPLAGKTLRYQVRVLAIE